MQIDRRAPLVTHHQIDIFAPPGNVWDWISRIEMWPTWRQDVSSARWLEGRGLNGAFKWRVRNIFGITARIKEWRENRSIGWQGRVAGGSIAQLVVISGEVKPSTVTIETSYDGPLTRLRLTRALVEGQINRTNEIWLGSLKTKLEIGKDEGTGGPAKADSTRPKKRTRRFRTGF